MATMRHLTCTTNTNLHHKNIICILCIDLYFILFWGRYNLMTMLVFYRIHNITIIGTAVARPMSEYGGRCGQWPVGPATNIGHSRVSQTPVSGHRTRGQINTPPIPSPCNRTLLPLTNHHNSDGSTYLYCTQVRIQKYSSCYFHPSLNVTQL